MPLKLPACIGSKYISPFGVFVSIFGKGAMRRKLRRKYPDLGSYDTRDRAISTSEFLHDFVIDVGFVERFHPSSHSIPQEAYNSDTYQHSRREIADRELTERDYGPVSLISADGHSALATTHTPTSRDDVEACTASLSAAADHRIQSA